jgi:UDP-GlcNAc:undecaprenyl-phosphate GlcNAc-1-phosphate transferase
VREYEYILILLVSAAVTYLLTPLVRRTAIRFGAVLKVRDRDVHVEPIPRMGGLAMYFGVAAGLLAASEIGPFRSVINTNAPDLVNGLLLAGGLIVVIGVIDDRWGMNSLAKAAGQVAAAGVLVHSGAQLSSFPLPKGGVFALTGNEGTLLTILVVVATINAVNFIDGLDGLAAGIVFIAAISFFIYYYSLTQEGIYGVPTNSVPALASVVIAGACLGFLPHNFHPARIFMGDTGAMLLGLLLAYVPISALALLDPTTLQNRANRFAEFLPLLLPAAVMVIPYTDLLRAVFRRVRAGQSPFAADNKHLHHRMLEIGHSHRSSVLILYAWAALFAAAIIGLSIATAPLAVLAGTTLAAVLVLVLLSLPRLRWWERRQVAAPARPARPPVVQRLPAGGPEPRGEPAKLRPAHGAAGNGGMSPHPMAESIALLSAPPEVDAAGDNHADTAPVQLPRRASGSIIP